MFVRSFQLSDYASITHLLRDVLSEACYEETMAALTKQLSWDSELVLTAVEDDRVVGIIIGTIDQGEGFFYRIAVHPDHQRKGIGRSMVATLKAKFQLRKVKRVRVTVDEHNEPILPLYESVGFHEQDHVRSLNRLSIARG